MDKIFVEKTFFNIEDTLRCGQTFSFFQRGEKFLVRSANKFAYLYYQNESVVIESEDSLYFYNYFDLQRDYSLSYNYARSFSLPILTDASEVGKGIRILNQDTAEVLFSFIISQNNNISRITKSINFLCEKLGKYNEKYNAYSFPTIEKLAKADIVLLKEAGLRYRAEYVLNTANLILSGKLNIKELKLLNDEQLKKELLKVKGIGEKVANCVMLFGFNRQFSFPVDTWIEKVYLQDFNFLPTSREKMTEYFINTFKEHSGIIQQYLFHYKRNGLK